MNQLNNLILIFTINLNIMVSLKEQLVHDLEILLRDKGHYNFTIEFVDKFNEKSICTGLTAIHDIFPVVFHVHHYELVNHFEVVLTWNQLPETKDYIIDRVINSRNWYDKQVTKQMLFQSILNINTMAEIAMEEIIYN